MFDRINDTVSLTKMGQNEINKKILAPDIDSLMPSGNKQSLHQ